MSLPRTELLPDHPTIDALPTQVAIGRMLDGQSAAIEAVRRANSEIADGAKLMAKCIRAGGSLIYVAAGSSGLMALADCCEIPGTFGVPTSQLQIHMAGGVPTTAAMPGNTEDETATVRDISIAADDVVIIASASGSTPYAIAAAGHAHAAGAQVIGIANNPDTPLLNAADVAICLETPAEIIAGSTRLGAGTAQKAAFNAMSSMMGVLLGHVYRGQMVNVVADNAKLQGRAANIVRQIAKVSENDAAEALQTAGGSVKEAVLIASGITHTTARTLLNENEGHLGPCLASKLTIN